MFELLKAYRHTVLAQQGYLALLGLELDLHPIPPSMLKVQKSHTGYLQ